MNRLVIIGNGFDLAHGLPTSYRSFLNFIWSNIHAIDTVPQIKNLFILNYPIFDYDKGIAMRFKDYNDFYQRMPRILDHYTYRNRGTFTLIDTFHGKKSFKIIYEQSMSYQEPQTFFDFKNKFFELITVQNAENWVDIENTYYQVLISLLDGDSKYSYIGSVERLNKEFEEIKELLEYYLTGSIENYYDFNDTETKINDISNLFDYKYKNLKDPDNLNNPYFLEFPPNYKNQLVDFDSLFSISNRNTFNVYENLFLDFNYTPTISSYLSILNNNRRINRPNKSVSTQIQIHGKLNTPDNSINFGFGDEMDENYKTLEKANDNNYLENIKSFMYLNNSNYKKLLNWIESNEYQVFIMGHSCGLSDRTLLNTVFEHNNCKSIKIFYHQKEDGTDNFKDLSQNISRHFNKKALMRSKVVDKSNSIPLPQNVRFNKIEKASN